MITRRRTWSIPEQPGRHVQVVEDEAGDTWVRVEHFDGELSDGWRPSTYPDDQPVSEWEDVLHEYGPLTDVTPDDASFAAS